MAVIMARRGTIVVRIYKIYLLSYFFLNKFVYTKLTVACIGQEQLCPKIMKKMKFWTFWTFLKILDIFENFGHFWTFLKILDISDSLKIIQKHKKAEKSKVISDRPTDRQTDRQTDRHSEP